MSPQRHVLLALTGAAMIFFVAGGRLDKVKAQLRGTEIPPTSDLGADTIAGWATLLLILIFVADLPPVSPLATGFAWLIFVSVAMLYGETAAQNLMGILGNPQTSLPVNNVVSIKDGKALAS